MDRADEEYFPPEYKHFPFTEGDLLISRRESGRYAVNKILKVDPIVVRTGESINIQGTRFTAPCDDWLIVVGMALGDAEYSSEEEAREAALGGVWKAKVSHAPIRAPGAAEGQVIVGSAPVTASELEGYKVWREAFDKGEAGIF